MHNARYGRYGDTKMTEENIRAKHATPMRILGIDPGLAHTGWGVIERSGTKLTCIAYGCVTTDASQPLEKRLLKIYQQITAVIDHFAPEALGIESVWFGENVSSAFATGQARGVALVSAAQADLKVGEYTPNQIKMAVVGVGHAEKEQIQYMVKQLLGLNQIPHPDHAADALAAAICYTTFGATTAGDNGGTSKFDEAVAKACARDDALREARRDGQ